MSKRVKPVTPRSYTLTVMPGEYAVCRLSGHAESPDWSFVSGGIWATLRTRDGVTTVCPVDAAPDKANCDPGWRVLKLKGPFDLDETGVLSAVITPLAEASISIFTLSTFETDYILVRGEHLDEAKAVLKTAGHKFTRGFSG